MNRHVSIWPPIRAAALALVLCHSSSAFAWNTPALLYDDISGTTRPDAHVSAAAASSGHWGVVWTSDAPVGTDFGILFQRSTNDAATWSVPVDLSQATANTSDTGDQPHLATDGNLTWIAAWDADSATTSLINSARDIRYARSTDAGANWAAPSTLNTDSADPVRTNSAVCLASDGAGVWIAAWQAQSTTASAYGIDSDIMFARSADNGQTWSAPVAVNDDATTDKFADWRPRVATDKTGNWIVAWQTYGATDVPTSSVLSDIRAARSADNGLTWQPAVLLSQTGAPDPVYDDHPGVAHAGGSNWVVAWVSSEVQTTPTQPGSRLWSTRSTNGGASFGAPVNLTSSTAFSSAAHPSITAAGPAVAILWDQAVAVDPQPRVQSALSADAGANWSVAGPITISPAGGGVRASVAANSVGRLLAAWPAGRVDRAADYYFATQDPGPATVADWMLWQ